jgi:hypothetical protein
MPEMALTNSPHATIVGEFMPLYERTVREEIEASRNFILQRAADFVLGKHGQVWLLSEHRANRGRRDDATREEVLRELDALRHAQR